MTVKKSRGGDRWEYDFRLLGERWRKGRFLTKTEASMAERLKREEILSGKRQYKLADVYERYMKSTAMVHSTRDSYILYWEHDLKKHLAHLYLEEVEAEVNTVRAEFYTRKLKPKTINNRLGFVKTLLNFARREMGVKNFSPFIRMEKRVKSPPNWYTVEQRDRFLDGVFDRYPQWYLFFYITCRLGLRRGEVYAIEHRQFQRDRMVIAIDQVAEAGVEDKPGRPGRPTTIRLGRKGKDTLLLQVTQDFFDAYDWHCKNGYAGSRFVFCPGDVLPKRLDNHVRPMRVVQDALGLPRSGFAHHTIGRHSVGSQAMAQGSTAPAVQQQLGHAEIASTYRYIHVQNNAQRKIVEDLRPAKAPHERAVAPADLN